MLQHVVAITWNDQVPPNYAETVSDVLQEMASDVPSVREFHCGPDLGISTAVNADYLIVATFDDVDGWHQYDEDVSHNEIRAKYLKPYVASRATAQINF